jgi:cell division protein FtsN
MDGVSAVPSQKDPMSKNETGEFELVLGNKQLLSVFFIVVILLGVFFTMGYIVGRNSSPPPLEASNRGAGTRSPLVVDSPTAPPPSQIPTATETKPPEEITKPTPIEPKPAVVEPPKPVVEEKPKPPVVEKEKPRDKAPAPVAAAAEAQKGQHYLQVQALPTEQAILVVEVMRKKGFPATTETVPTKPGLTRVLVGPIPAASANEMKDKLEAAGFKGKQAILRKI